MKVVVIPCPGPVGIFRGSMPATFLRASGHDVSELHEQCGLSREEQERRIREADVILYIGPGGRRCFDERPAPFVESSAALVVELDDDQWAWPEDVNSKDPFHEQLTKAQGVLLDEQRLANLESWIRGADLVTTTTPALAERLRARGAGEVLVCPNGLHPDWVRPRQRRGELQVAHDPSSVLAKSKAKWGGSAAAGRADLAPARRVAWTGSIAHKEDVKTAGALPALRRLAFADSRLEVFSLGPVDFSRVSSFAGFAGDYRRILCLRFAGLDASGRQVAEVLQQLAVDPEHARAILAQDGGSDTVPFGRPLPGGKVDWVYVNTVAGMDPNVAILPMRNSPFNSAKSPLTLHTWAAMGVPVVCSRTGPYAVEAEQGFPAVFVAHDDVDAWYAAVRDLLYDEEKALELGARARTWVMERHAFPKAIEPWELAITRAIARRKERIGS